MVVVERTRDWNKKKEKKECDYRMFTTSSKNVDDKWRIFIELLFGFLFSFWSFSQEGIIALLDETRKWKEFDEITCY